MTTKGFKRKLAAILSADVKGYRRLTAEEEVAVRARLIQRNHTAIHLCNRREKYE